jgi:hypothetical protein
MNNNVKYRIAETASGATYAVYKQIYNRVTGVVEHEIRVGVYVSKISAMEYVALWTEDDYIDESTKPIESPTPKKIVQKRRIRKLVV